ncbi:MAG: ABC transporter permease [Oscillospiraceae bacterium]|nr:ABC transporter permease [Oscillospiraceae bacterium]
MNFKSKKISEHERNTGEVALEGFAPFTLSVTDLEPVSVEERERQVRMRESTTYLKDALRRFLKNKMAVVCFFMLILIAVFAFAGPHLSPYSYEQQVRGSERLKPCLEHPFGTDSLGRDMLVRTMVGTRISLTIGVFSSLIVLVIGTTIGAVSGYLGGMADNIIMRFCEILYTIPDVLIIILLQISLKSALDAKFPDMATGTGMISIFIAFALLYWVTMARMVRGQILTLKEREYVLAAKAMGAPAHHIIRRHLLPNAIGTIIVTAMFQIPYAIFTESFLSFIGLGVSAPMASLGSLANRSLDGLASYPYLMFFPAMTIALIIFCFNQFGDGLRDALDPRFKE